jgi:hypothetical protein
MLLISYLLGKVIICAELTRKLQLMFFSFSLSNIITCLLIIVLGFITIFPMLIVITVGILVVVIEVNPSH